MSMNEFSLTIKYTTLGTIYRNGTTEAINLQFFLVPLQLGREFPLTRVFYPIPRNLQLPTEAGRRQFVGQLCINF